MKPEAAVRVLDVGCFVGVVWGRTRSSGRQPRRNERAAPAVRRRKNLGLATQRRLLLIAQGPAGERTAGRDAQ